MVSYLAGMARMPSKPRCAAPELQRRGDTGSLGRGPPCDVGLWLAIRKSRADISSPVCLVVVDAYLYPITICMEYKSMGIVGLLPATTSRVFPRAER